MKILDVIHSPWAIQPDKLLEIQGIYATHLRGEKIDIKGIEASIGKPLNNVQQGYSVTDGVAVLPITGVISKRMNLMQQISGGTSSELVARDLKAAMNDPAVNAIILQIDSPGGTVDGTQTLSNLVSQASAVKPCVALADGCMASAAYWVGSAASAIYMTDNLTQVGSIGVVATHTDISGAEAAKGVKTTEISAGKFKRITSQYGALSESGKQSMQDQVDYLYSVFVQNVADNRGVSVDTVLQDMADGRVFIGQQAIDAGLVDGVSTLDALIAKLSQQGAGAIASARVQVQSCSQISAVAEIQSTEGNQDMKITMQDVLAHAPDIATALREEGAAAALTQGATAERERIQAVFAQTMTGHDALIQSLAFDGKTTGPEAAVAVLNAEKNLRADVLSDRRADAPQPAPYAAAPSGESAAAEGEQDVAVVAKSDWDKDASLRAEFGANFNQYLAYRTAQASGQVKILGNKE
jgi:signal peptide peptidase SppA